MEVGGQHDQVALLNAARQRELFDDAAGCAPLAAKVRGMWGELQAMRCELEALTGENRLRDQRQELLRFQLKELEEASLEDGELDTLQAERTRLSNRERLVSLTGLGAACLAEAPPGESSAAELLSRALGAIEEAGELDAELAPIREELATAHAIISDAAFTLTKYMSRSEADPERLQEIEERIQVIKRVLKKHGPTEAQALAALDAIRTELETEGNRDQRRELIGESLARLERQFEGKVRDLSAARARAVDGFCKPLVAMLRDFAMPKVRFSVELPLSTSGVALPGGGFAGSDGAEEVEFLFSANDGEAMQPLRRVASGGELSRVLLALRTMGAEGSRVPLLVFDEVDAGLSGVAARRVGERLAALSQRSQVLCVTHNANVAALADQHLLVEKRSVAGRTISTVRTVDGIPREEEVARLLDGGKISTKGLALAAELLTRAG
jgi:DNA repair protein RecN (Recombination protein N)